jgi:hypothetical protein
MKTKNRRRERRRYAINRVLIMALCVLICAPLISAQSTPAGPTEDTLFFAGIRNTPGAEGLNAGQLNQVLESLREKTGWQSLHFNKAGILVCPAPDVFNGGSEAARRLLGGAIFGDKAYYLEAHNRSAAVSFARLEKGIDYVSHRTGAKITAHSLQIDFADFHQLQGHGPAIKAFDLGLVTLHELAHGVWQLRDAERAENEPGECETYVNQIRRELQLPERKTYVAKVHAGRLNVKNGTRLIAVLRFTRFVKKEEPAEQIDQADRIEHARQTKQVKQEKFFLQWEAEEVGPIIYGSRVGKPSITAAFQ